MSRILVIQDPVRMLKDLVLEKFDLSDDQQRLLDLIHENGRITETVRLKLLNPTWQGPTSVPTDIEGLDLSVKPSATAHLELAFFPEEQEVQLADLDLPLLDRSKETLNVPAGRVICGIELLGELGVEAGAEGKAKGVSIELEAHARAGSRIRFFKEFRDTTGAFDILKGTLGAYKLPLRAIRQHPDDGEILVADFDGNFRIGARLGYGWSVEGTRNFGEDLEGTGLISSYSARARAGVNASFSIFGGLSLVVRRSERGRKWVNVSFVKRTDAQRQFGLSLEVDARIETKTAGGRPAGEFLDTLLGRTPVPDLMQRLREFDPAADLEQQKQRALQSISETITELAGPTVDRLDVRYQEVLGQIEEFVNDYHQFNRDVVEFALAAIERFSSLEKIDDVVDRIAEIADSGELLEEFRTGLAEKLQDVLGLITEELGIDLSQTSWIENKFTDIKDLVSRYRTERSQLKQKLEQSYLALRKQLRIEDGIERIRLFLGERSEDSLRALLDEKIVWLNEYLGSRLDRPIEAIVDRLEPAVDAARSVASGYDRVVAKAKAALEGALNKQLQLQTSIAWTSVREKETLASIDVNLGNQNGRRAYRHLLRGNVAQVLNDRLRHADAIRFRKSYFLDRLVRGVSVRAIVNGKNRTTVKDYIVDTRATLEPTETGEIWVQTSKVASRFKRDNRRAMINVSTMFEFAFEEIFELTGADRMVGQGFSVRDYKLSYQFAESLKETKVTAPDLIKELRRLRTRIDVATVKADRFEELVALVQDVGSFGDLGKVTIRFLSYLAPGAVEELFMLNDGREVEREVKDAWDRAVAITFAEHPRVVQFFMDNRDRTIRVDDPTLAPWNLQGFEASRAFQLVSTRGSFAEKLGKLHKQVFLHGRRDRIQPILGRLGAKMKWINNLEKDVSRDFIMTVFSYLAEPHERGGSIVVEYEHPVGDLSRQLRVDEPPVEIG